ncbi:MAG: NAD(P)H-dependent oxidoreductase [Propionibacteriaceae bacterium]|nr:NAD(P)H-dependent oxidoreductase [Propionibacteriaceae bacterium]
MIGQEAPELCSARVLVVLGHPDSGSFNNAICDAYVAGLRQGVEVEVLKLGELEFDPVLRFGYRQRMEPDPVIERSQELVRWADHLVFVFPVWWSNMPSLLKGWFDRVFTPGFAYNEDNSSLLTLGFKMVRRLSGRTATIITTFDGPPWYFWATGVSPVRLVKRQNLALCGVKTTQVLTFGWVGSPKKDSQARREAFLARVAHAAARLNPPR